VTDVLVDRAGRAMTMMDEAGDSGAAPTLVVAGGVAANQTLRAALTGLCDARGWRFVAPAPALCTDNAAMVAWAGLERLRLGLSDPLDFRPRPRWPLDPDAPKRAGAGVKA
jgi:N6-L-threonylcarbamoyladenine synthase